MASQYATMVWMNIELSIERIFREMFPAIPVYRALLPESVAEQRALIDADDKAIFLYLVPGKPDRFQDTYGTFWLCEANTPQTKYLPVENLTGSWIREKSVELQRALSFGDSTNAHLWPIYDYKNLIPAPIYDAYLISGDTTTISGYLAGTPQQIANTGFIVRPGSANPSLTLTQNPMLFEMPLVFQHCNKEIYQGQRG